MGYLALKRHFLKSYQISCNCSCETWPLPSVPRAWAVDLGAPPAPIDHGDLTRYPGDPGALGRLTGRVACAGHMVPMLHVRAPQGHGMRGYAVPRIPRCNTVFDGSAQRNGRRGMRSAHASCWASCWASMSGLEVGPSGRDGGRRADPDAGSSTSGRKKPPALGRGWVIAVRGARVRRRRPRGRLASRRRPSPVA
jgi:hypothetical protein